MPCTEVKSAKYQTRKSPAFHAHDCKGLQKKGKDGIYVSQADSNGVYKWVKKVNQTKKQKGKFYDTHDNGARPFRVYVDGSKVAIYHNSTLIKKVTVKKVHLGKSGRSFGIGNSILLHVSGKKYIYIGEAVYEFQMEDEVDSYFSLLGNSDVPYPVLLGTENVYFMLDHRYVPRYSFPSSMTTKDWEDAYARYYGFVGDDPLLEKKSKKMKGFHMIVKRGA